jgi:hypothetical protein
VSKPGYYWCSHVHPINAELDLRNPNVGKIASMSSDIYNMSGSPNLIKLSKTRTYQLLN